MTYWVMLPTCILASHVGAGQVLVAPLLIQPLADDPGTAVEDGLSAWTPACMEQT